MDARQLLDELSQLDLSHTYNGMHKFCPHKIEKFLSTKNEPDKTYLQLIIKHTQYVTYNEFKNKLFDNIDLLIKKYNRFNIFYVTKGNKIGSEHWLIALVWHKIKDHVAHIVTSFEFGKIENDYPVVYIDDAAYSGHNMTLHFDNLTYYKLVGENNKFVIATPYITRDALCVLLSLNKKMKDRVELLTPYAHVEIKSDREINEIKEYREKFGISVDYRYDHFGLETDSNVPIYFDHKIANEFASFPFFHQIVEKDTHFRDPIELVEEYIKKFSSRSN